MRQKPLLVAALALTVGIVSMGSARAGHLRAGAGKASITSTADEFPYTALRERPYVGVHDEVYARALVLDDGQHRVAIVTVEATVVPDPAQTVKEVAAAISVPESSVMVSASHTHIVPLVSNHGPPDAVMQNEIKRAREGAVEAARQAMAHLAPARIAFSRGEAWANINNGEAAGLTSGYDPHGPSDKSLDIIRVQNEAGAPIALIVNYASHGEVMFRSVTKNNGYLVSGDLPGAVSRMLEEHWGGSPVLYTSAAEADQLPLFKSLQPADGEVPEKDEGAAGWALLDVQARRVAAAAMKAVASMQPGVSEVHISTASDSVTCPGQLTMPDPVTRGPGPVVDAPPISIPLSLIRINDIALAGVAGDLGSEIGSAIKGASPVPHTTVVTMLAGSVGYLLPDSSYQQPGHGIHGAHLKPGCLQPAMVKAFNQMMKASMP